MLEGLVESVKFLGGLGGLASSIFLVYDRLFRSAPLAYLVPDEYQAKLRFKNTTNETIIIDEISIRPPIVSLAKADDVKTHQEDTAAVWYPSMNDKDAMRVFIILPPDAERSFGLKRSAEFENSDDRRQIKIRCKWRNTRKPLPFGFQRSRTLLCSKRDVTALRQASLAGKV